MPKITPAEKCANIRELYKGGMTVLMLSRKLKMAVKTINKIVAGVPSPHDDPQALYARLGQMRKHGQILPLGSIGEPEDIY